MKEKNSLIHEKAAQGNISRRQFMGQVAMTAASFTLAGKFLSGTRAYAAGSKRGGRITVGVIQMTSKDSLDPVRYYDNADYLRGSTCYNSLLTITEDLLPSPALAESWESNADATEWVFKLRKGVQFHNGKELNAEDVRYSLMRHLVEGSESVAKPYLSQIVKVVSEDKHTTKIFLSSPNADLPIILADYRTHIVPDGHTDFNKAIGTGPFKVKQFKPGSVAIFERNENYWEEGLPYLDQVEFVGIPDHVARQNALMAGDVDVIVSVPAGSISLLKRRSDVSLIASKSSSHCPVVMMCDRKPTDNNDFRLGMKYAIDRQKIVDGVYKGYAHIGNDHQISPISPFYNHNLPQRIYDPDKARHYFKKAGMENAEIKIFTSDTPGPGAVETALYYQQAANKCGIKMKVENVPADSYWTVAWMQQPVCVSGWVARLTPDLMFSVANASSAEYNETVWKNEQFDKLLVEARGVTDFEKRKEIYGEMQLMLQETGGVIVPAFYDTIDAVRSKVNGLKPHSAGALMYYQGIKNVWLSA